MPKIKQKYFGISLYHCKSKTIQGIKKRMSKEITENHNTHLTLNIYNGKFTVYTDKISTEMFFLQVTYDLEPL